MNEKPEIELTEGSQYKIFSLGGKENMLETEGTFKGFTSLGVDEPGLLMELNRKHGEMVGKIRIVPLHVVLAIDILEAVPNQKKDDTEEMDHYVG